MLKPPALLTRTQAMHFTGLGRKPLEKLADEGKVRAVRTNGNHRRYHRDDFIKLNLKNEKHQQ
jgi:excisionase family DNA binding protein